MCLPPLLRNLVLSSLAACIGCDAAIQPQQPRANSTSSADTQIRSDMPIKRRTLTAALKTHSGDYAAALQAIGLELELDDAGNITRIVDSSMMGQLDDQEFALLANIPTLTGIYLRELRITDDGLAALERMPQLTSLMLAAENLTDNGLRHLKHVPNLTILHLSRTQVTGTGLEHLPHPERITWLDFTKAPINDTGLKSIARCRNVESLGLWGTAVTDKGLGHLTACDRLERLSLYETAVTDEAVQTLASLPALIDLELQDTKVSDRCVEALLRIPQLTHVGFGSEQISASTFEKLTQAGIKVDHGKLLNVVRTENLLRYVGMDFEVDPEDSKLVAFIDPTGKSVFWQFDINCTEKYVPSHMQPAHLEGPHVPSNKPWRELVGETLKISFDPDDIHPILPDNPSNIYVGWHAAPNNHRIKFLKRVGNRFQIDWHCEAGESKNENVPVWVFAEIPFTELVVIAPTPFTADEANHRAAAHFDLQDFDGPQLDDNPDYPTATFRVAAQD